MRAGAKYGTLTSSRLYKSAQLECGKQGLLEAGKKKSGPCERKNKPPEPRHKKIQLERTLDHFKKVSRQA